MAAFYCEAELPNQQLRMAALDVPAETRLNKNNGLPWVNLSKLIEFTI
jgi:hypothetical protein